jgi:hypothetical protein
MAQNPEMTMISEEPDNVMLHSILEKAVRVIPQFLCYK